MLFSVSQSIGLPALAGLVLGESAGLPIPGETALIVAGGMASSGHFSLPVVIAVAAMAAMLGDIIGYWVGRRGGRALLLRPGRFSAHRISAVEKADRYFERYGLVTVFFARFVPGVRVVGALAAGATRMRFRSFAIANAGGCWAWATTVGTIAYLVGPKGAGVMIVIGFTVAAIGTISAVMKTRSANASEQEYAEAVMGQSPLDDLATYAETVAGAATTTSVEDPSPRTDGGVRHTSAAHGTSSQTAVGLAACSASNRLP
ncbi:MAG: DedA family protein [Solirubrobacteraceae bacterium]|nr:DedA family protein [Patulibacter sp.]